MKRPDYSRISAIVGIYVSAIIFLWLSEISGASYYFSEVQWSFAGVTAFVLIYIFGARNFRPKWILLPPFIMVIWPALVGFFALILMVIGYAYQIKHT